MFTGGVFLVWTRSRLQNNIVHGNVSPIVAVPFPSLCCFNDNLKCKHTHQDKSLFVWFVYGFSSHTRIFHSYEDVIITGDGLQILTNARHSWHLSSEGSLACHIYCDTEYPLIMVISEDP